jgi:hypothetical protein
MACRVWMLIEEVVVEGFLSFEVLLIRIALVGESGSGRNTSLPVQVWMHGMERLDWSIGVLSISMTPILTRPIAQGVIFEAIGSLVWDMTCLACLRGPKVDES